MSPLQAGLLTHLSEYKDVLFARRTLANVRGVCVRMIALPCNRFLGDPDVITLLSAS